MKSANWIRLLILVAGLNYLLTGLALLVAPTWFFENIGTFGPFNRHYLGDLGAFLLPIGIGLLLAARQPRQHYLLIAVVATGNIIHASNHIYDAILGQEALARWFSDTIPLVFFASIFMLVFWDWWQQPLTIASDA
jgi:hypothetical protein